MVSFFLLYTDHCVRDIIWELDLQLTWSPNKVYASPESGCRIITFEWETSKPWSCRQSYMIVTHSFKYATDYWSVPCPSPPLVTTLNRHIYACNCNIFRRNYQTFFNIVFHLSTKSLGCFSFILLSLSFVKYFYTENFLAVRSIHTLHSGAVTKRITVVSQIV